MFYLKYRPQTIAEIDNSKVRELIIKILRSYHLPHAYLFFGQKGTGKTSTARIFAKAINCLNNDFSKEFSSKENIEPCNQCDNCLSIKNSNFADVIEMDAASNRGIDEIKNLIRETAFLPMVGRFRVFIIDEAHMITTEGFNALLKTLEEPPKTAFFILATTNPEKVPKTIASRCVQVSFGKASKSDLIKMLKKVAKSENLSLADNFYEIISRHCDYSFRDAVKILEEVAIQKITTTEDLESFLGIRGKDILLELVEKKDIQKTFAWLVEFSQNGGNFKNLIEDLLEELRVQLLIKRGLKVEVNREINLRLNEISLLMKLLLQAYQQLKYSPVDSLPLEIALNDFYNQTDKR
ncbi:MAG: DNA polymerase III subunit gamma/tau [Patescibacteria group bacterium]|nr:DNA polymerase III subunit gamma/tau [Patescibacteria group bacterium]